MFLRGINIQPEQHNNLLYSLKIHLAKQIKEFNLYKEHQW